METFVLVLVETDPGRRRPAAVHEWVESRLAGSHGGIANRGYNAGKLKLFYLSGRAVFCKGVNSLD
jgi:hypothetical protein